MLHGRSLTGQSRRHRGATSTAACRHVPAQRAHRTDELGVELWVGEPRAMPTRHVLQAHTAQPRLPRAEGGAHALRRDDHVLGAHRHERGHLLRAFVEPPRALMPREVARDHDGRPELLLEDVIHRRVLQVVERVEDELGGGLRLVQQARHGVEQHHAHHPPRITARAVAPRELRHVGRAERVARHHGALHAVPGERRVEQRGEAVGRGGRRGEDALAEGVDVQRDERRRVVGALV
eukprot:scaffold13829_cov69-Phaeocystis_antarctica.AAC.5